MSLINKRIVLKRVCSERTNDNTLLKQVDYIAKRAVSGSRGIGWEVKVSENNKPFQNEGNWIFDYKIELTKENGKGDAWNRQWANIVKVAIKTGNGTRFNKFPWRVTEPTKEEINHLIGNDLEETFLPDNSRVTVHDEKLLPEDADEVHQKHYADISLDRGDFFSHIYDRQAQIERIISAIKAAKHSGMENRFHCVLYGPPGCGKSDILLSVCRMLGKESEAYIKLDATSMTQAGIETLLLDPNTPKPQFNN
jgi:chromosomal replication initiation ATPase DnaA